MKKAIIPLAAIGVAALVFGIRASWRNPEGIHGNGSLQRDPSPGDLPAPPAPVPPAVAPPRTGSLRIQVFEEARAIEGAGVEVVQVKGAEKRSFMTLADGSRLLEGMPPGAYTVKVHHLLRVPQHQGAMIEADQTTTLRFDLAAGGGIQGRVTDPGGLPVPEALVRVLHPKTGVLGSPELQVKTDAEGRYTLQGVPIQEFDLNCWHPRYKHWEKTNLQFREPGDLMVIDAVLERGVQISGRVVEDPNTPIQGAIVMGLNEDTYAAVTDPDGRFELFGLGKSAVGLSVQAKGYGTVYVRGIAPETKDLVVRLPRAGEISGKIISAPFPKVYAILVFQYDPEIGREIQLQPRLVQEPGGGFVAKDIGPGTYRVEVSAPGFDGLDKPYVVVNAGTTTSDITLRLKKSE